MKKILNHRLFGAAVLSAALLFASAASSQAITPQPDLNYFVVLNVAPLIGNANGPFSLDLQLANGSGTVVNTVTLSNFAFVGGSATGSPNFTAGGETGSLTSTVTLTNSSFNNELAQAFSSGVTQISFHVDQTVNPETGINPTAEQFNVFIDDNSTFSIPTTDPGGSLVSSTITEGEVMGDVQTFTSTGSEAGAVGGVSAVPEPGSAAMLLIGAVGLIARRKRSVTAQVA